MSAQAVAAAPAESALSRIPLLGVAVFIVSESMFFLGVIFAFVQVRPADVSQMKAQLDLARTAVFSVCLFASSGTVALSHRGGGRHRGWLLLTWILGAVFLVGQGTEYARLLSSGFSPSSDVFGSAFFTLTGLHGLHVLVGLVAMGTLLVIATARPRGLSGVAWEAVTWYWHFVDAVWVVVFSVVYLWTALS
ncbi:MAG: heme-copper oxidase subunit III [Chloroflexota bacterium]|nr:heme-copper oxidase subunit III [Chloroflexota bacterium]MDE3193293.1 heme-copper oxidase subunit III [Chloroflexota bacterium]